MSQGGPYAHFLLKPAMNTVFRSLLHTNVYRNSLIIARAGVPALKGSMLSIRPQKLSTLFLQKRLAASSVTNRPGSQTLEHATINVKEELGGTASDVAKIIAGANVTTDSVSDTRDTGSFVSAQGFNLLISENLHSLVSHIVI